ncbi:MAG: hypothetical protein ACKO4Z_04530 [Planctomycetota bacterium]|nr:hypothetical protein [Planctomycetota bacterium]
MASAGESVGIPDERIAIERRADGTVVVRVRSELTGSDVGSLPDAVFSFRNGDPQYSYWLRRFNDRRQTG